MFQTALVILGIHLLCSRIFEFIETYQISIGKVFADMKEIIVRDLIHEVHQQL